MVVVLFVMWIYCRIGNSFFGGYSEKVIFVFILNMVVKFFSVDGIVGVILWESRLLLG